jgi:hypothetical protein
VPFSFLSLFFHYMCRLDGDIGSFLGGLFFVRWCSGITTICRCIGRSGRGASRSSGERRHATELGEKVGVGSHHHAVEEGHLGGHWHPRHEAGHAWGHASNAVGGGGRLGRVLLIALLGCIVVAVLLVVVGTRSRRGDEPFASREGIHAVEIGRDGEHLGRANPRLLLAFFGAGHHLAQMGHATEEELLDI